MTPYTNFKELKSDNPSRIKSRAGEELYRPKKGWKKVNHDCFIGKCEQGEVLAQFLDEWSRMGE